MCSFLKTMLYILLTLFSTFFLRLQGRESIKLCVVGKKEMLNCLFLKNLIFKAGVSNDLVCMQARDTSQCMIDVESRFAHATMLDSGHLFVGGEDFNLQPILAESFDWHPDSISANKNSIFPSTNKEAYPWYYRSIAVVKKSDKSINSLHDLKGKRSCHTGVGRSAGWKIPIGTLINKNVIPVLDCNDQLYSASQFFSSACAVGALSKKFKTHHNVNNMCLNCKSQDSKWCTKDDEYSGYQGALKCLRDGAGDVAFTKPSEMKKMVEKKELIADDYELLCLDGSRKPVEAFSECYWAKSPAHALVVFEGEPNHVKDTIKNFFLEASAKLGKKMFNNEAAKIFSKSTTSLIEVDKDYQKFLGEYGQALHGLTKCEVEYIHWCVSGEDELKKCHEMSLRFKLKRIAPRIICISSGQNITSSEEGYEKCSYLISQGKADITMIRGSFIKSMAEAYNLKPILYEDNGNGYSESYAVAVAKNSDKEINFYNFLDKKSCHSSFSKYEGWKAPIGYMIHSGKASVGSKHCDVLKQSDKFFQSSCVPGWPAKSNKKCDLCEGISHLYCSENINEPFYGDEGAANCVLQGRGDVAFVNSKILKNPKYENDLKLLCPNGNSAPLFAYQRCNIDKIAPGTIMASKDMSTKKIVTIYNMMKAAERKFEENYMHIYKDEKNKDILFKDSTLKIELVPQSLQNYRKWLGENTINILNSYNCDEI